MREKSANIFLHLIGIPLSLYIVRCEVQD